ncbi:MAG TPA: hypothetical protein VD997_00925 [Phycisphaerales bacterium]|nr:hypothetical protein [Phycisphaerales bacterium]
MNWLLFVVIAWLFLGLEQGLRDAFALGALGFAPSFAFVLMAFVAMSAPRTTVFWTAAALGVCLDLLFRLPMPQSTGMVTIVGPHAIAYALAAQLILSMRALMMRRNPLTLGFLAFVGALLALIILNGIYTIRDAAGAPIEWQPKRQLVAAMGSALYTGVLALVLAFVLLPLTGALGFPDHKSRWGGQRR